MKISVDAKGLIKALDTLVTNLPKELKIVSWKTSKVPNREIAREVTKELAVTQKVVKKQLNRKRFGQTGAEVSLDKSKRLPVAAFRPRHTRKGVTYKIDKRKPRQLVPNGFMGPTPKIRKWDKPYTRQGGSQNATCSALRCIAVGCFCQTKEDEKGSRNDTP